MVTIHAQLIGDLALLSRAELDRLLELARRSESIALELEDDEWSSQTVMRLADAGKAFDFWKEPGEAIYTLQDGEPL
jgi:hypothetical protein